jgi:predicted MFS family arabinose efflux permease
MSKDIRKHPKGYWVGIGISIGIAIGAGLGPIFDNFGVGIGVGVALGAAIGTALEQRHKDELRPLTEQEKVSQRRSILIGVALTTLLVIGSIIAYLLVGR